MTKVGTDYAVLFVCMGNICRSPTAHGVFRAMVQAQGLAQVEPYLVHCQGLPQHVIHLAAALIRPAPVAAGGVED